MAKRKKKEILPKVDGLGPKEIKQIRTALRQVWSWSYSRRLVVARCLLPNGFSKCEKCKEVVAKIFVDHKKQVGDVDEGFIKRLFVASRYMWGLCKKCHDPKTRAERKAKRDKIKAEACDDFF